MIDENENTTSGGTPPSASPAPSASSDSGPESTETPPPTVPTMQTESLDTDSSSFRTREDGASGPAESSKD